MNVHDFTVKAADGSPFELRRMAGKVLLIVNTASRCGFTPQYAGLEELQQRFGARGFSVLAFPCNQFGQQEPGSAAQIATFCETRFQISFPVLQKVAVNGPDADPLFKFLRQARPGLFGLTGIKWNFTKFLVDAAGTPRRRFGPSRKPANIAPQIEALLG